MSANDASLRDPYKCLKHILAILSKLCTDLQILPKTMRTQAMNLFIYGQIFLRQKLKRKCTYSTLSIQGRTSDRVLEQSISKQSFLFLATARFAG